MTTLHVRRIGIGPPIVLVHAGFVDQQLWSAAQLALSAAYDVVTYDVRGAGRSPRDPVDHAPCDDLVALLDELHLDRVAIVGLSMGARIGLEVAATRPERVRALVL